MINQEVLRIIVAKGAGDSTLKKVNRYLNSNPVNSLCEICNDIELMCSAGIKRDVAQNIYDSKEKAQLLEEQLYRNNVDMCWIGDECFPTGLKNLSVGSSPAVLFYKGNYELLQNKCVGFTGSRNVSDTGIKITESSARQLSSDGIAVVSGYAKGGVILRHIKLHFNQEAVQFL